MSSLFGYGGDIFNSESLYVMLSSRNNPHGVANGEIITQFATPLNFPRDRFEVGLLNVSFTPDEEKSNQKLVAVQAKKLPVLRTINEEPTKLFPNLKPPTVQKLTVSKTHDELFYFVTEDINKVFQPNNFYFTTFSTKAPPNGNVFLTLKNNISDGNDFALFPSNLAKALGFTKRRVFPPGEFLASEIAKTELLSSFAKDTKFNVDLVKLEDRQNLIEVKEEIESLIYYKVTDVSDYKKFFTDFCNKLGKRGFDLSISWYSDDKAVLEFKSATNRSEDYIVLSEQLAECLNFENDTFHVGIHTATEPFNLKAFQSIKVNDVLWSRICIFYASLYPMNEPASMKHEDVLEEINKALGADRLPEDKIEFLVDEEAYLTVNDIGKTTTVQLPTAVNIYFGFEKAATFANGTRLALTQEIVVEEEEEEYDEEKQAEGEILPTDGGSHVFVLTNITENQLSGSRRLPAIRMIPMPEENKRYCETYSPVIYQALNCADVSKLRVRFTDQYGRQIKFKEGTETAVQLHFRPKYLNA